MRVFASLRSIQRIPPIRQSLVIFGTDQSNRASIKRSYNGNRFFSLSYYIEVFLEVPPET